MNYKDIESVYCKLISTIRNKLIDKYYKLIEENPELLIEYLKELRLIQIERLNQSYAYSFAKLSLQGHMPLIENECFWKDTIKHYDKPKFVCNREYVIDKETYDRNPFTYFGSDFGDYDEAFNIIVQYENNINFKKRIKNTFDITIIVDKDLKNESFENNPLYVKEGKAFFIFRVDIEHNKEDAIVVLNHLKSDIVKEKVDMILKESFNNLIDEYSENIINKLSL